MVAWAQAWAQALSVLQSRCGHERGDRGKWGPGLESPGVAEGGLEAWQG